MATIIETVVIITILFFGYDFLFNDGEKGKKAIEKIKGLF